LQITYREAAKGLLLLPPNGVCLSCTTGRVVETSAHLADHVMPRLSVRKWVLSVPKRLQRISRGMRVAFLTANLPVRCPASAACRYSRVRCFRRQSQLPDQQRVWLAGELVPAAAVVAVRC